jgi:hypothetical protein
VLISISHEKKKPEKLMRSNPRCLEK